ncbi:YdcF family protein [Lentilactobacillus kefiri]|uniref:YdcF family protein n=1 Tax=Lentilactobacillus kefiri TaxID=33962 RepID=UPI0012E72EF4|nr:YdcF family protein [Lentilactobacillus kefiri]QGV25761.1 YdcF family protein [Lentilactobacillus kefiri]
MWMLSVTGIVFAILTIFLGTYLIKNRNSTVIGWLTNLDLLALLVLLTQSFELIGQKYYALVLAVALIVVGLAVILGLILSFVFLFVNAIVVWRKEEYSLSGSLTLIAGVGVVLVDILIFFNPINAPAPIQTFIMTFLTMLILYILLTVWNTISSMLLYQLYFPRNNKDYIIILGAGLIDGHKVGRLLGGRINKGIEFYNHQIHKANKHAKIILSGGQGGDEKVPESVAMRDYALEHGARRADMMVETKSINTYQNMQFSKKIIEGDANSSQVRVIFVTSNYHTLRAGILARKVGMNAFGIGSKTPFYYLPNAVIREYLAFVVMHKKFHLMMVGLMLIAALVSGIGVWLGIM